jgi:agmatine deiminase
MTTPDSPASQGFRMPAEWEPHDAVWLAWPYDPETFPGRVPQVEAAYIEIIHALHRSETVNLFVLDAATRDRVAARLTARGVNLSCMRFHTHDYADVWFRDYGPLFLLGPDNRELAMSHWIFNAWGGKYEPLKRDTRIPEIINRDMNLRRFAPGIVLEGGSIDVNGLGAALTTEQCLLNSNRNPSLDRAGIERILAEYLGARHIIWLKNGVAGDDTDGHIDDIARFVAPGTVLCALPDDPSDPSAAALRENFKILRSATDQDGAPLRVLPLPTPGLVGPPDAPLPASYANFYIGNSVVLAPAFGVPADAVAVDALRAAFPGRDVVPIPCADLVHGLGTLHCISQQQPKIQGSGVRG